MKKNMILLLTCLMVLTLLPFSVPVMAAPSSVPINQSNFPDQEFRDYVSYLFDTSPKDGKLDAAEIAAATYFDGLGLDIYSFRGIEYLTALESLDCYGTKITSLDVSHNTRLKALYVEETPLRSLDVTRNTALEILEIGGSDISSLNLKKNGNLRSFGAAGAPLTSLDLSGNTRLSSVNIRNTRIRSLNISSSPMLVNVYYNYDPERSTLGTSSTNLVYDEDPSSSMYSIDYDRYGSLFFDNSTAIQCRPYISSQPSSASKKEGETVTFRVSAKGATKYQWWVRKSTTGDWTKVYAKGTSASYRLKTAARHNGYQYRCRVSNTDGGIWSKTVKLTVRPLPRITVQPEDVTAVSGETAVFRVTAREAVKYQWWVRKEQDGVWTKVLSGGTSAVYRLKTADRHNGYQYRCRVSNTEGGLWSKTVRLTVITAPKVTLQPDPVSVPVGNTASFTVRAEGAGLRYQWWVRKTPSGAWSKVLSGGTSRTYSLTTAARHNGYQYRCRVSNAAGGVWSKTVRLTVITRPAVISQPEDVTVMAGRTASFAVGAEGEGLRYQWWYRTASSGTWTKVLKNGKSALYTLKTEKRHNGYQYRCRISNAAGGVWSKTVTLKVYSRFSY